MSSKLEQKKMVEKLKKSPAYKIAYHDNDFMDKEFNRPSRLELELLKPEMILRKEKIKSTIALNKIKVLWHEVNVIINKHSHTGWTTHGHNAVNVETFAYGKGAEKFRGFMDNTDIAKKIFEVLGRESK